MVVLFLFLVSFLQSVFLFRLLFFLAIRLLVRLFYFALPICLAWHPAIIADGVFLLILIGSSISYLKHYYFLVN